MKEIALSATHKTLGAKMVPFAGYNMPVSYEGVTVEHQKVREGVGVFDVSHMGEFFIEGPRALELIQKVTSNDASKLEVGRAQYSCLPNETGGVVDDLIVYQVKPETYLLVVNASNIEKDWAHISKYNEESGPRCETSLRPIPFWLYRVPKPLKLCNPSPLLTLRAFLSTIL